MRKGSPLRVGFIGLGGQGAPMARRIAEAGFETTLWANRRPSRRPPARSSAGPVRPVLTLRPGTHQVDAPLTAAPGGSTLDSGILVNR
ncbi:MULTISPECIES: NAD(P)-binding domain-containing protein [Streptomyces]|uniref:NAD(P)-binding domain-containing protein n=1 Tax=Streptomyces sp. 900129855 TaxID=3155129 RepID=A0ABV2ZIK4_9ACTN